MIQRVAGPACAGNPIYRGFGRVGPSTFGPADQADPIRRIASPT
jgi:hypothetical protein